MTQALSIPGTQVILETHSLLRDIDPARWRDEVESAFRVRLQRAQEGMAQLAASRGDHRLGAMREKFAELAQLMREYAPQRTKSDSSSLCDDWLAFRVRVAPAYESLAVALRAHHIDIPSLRPTNYVRTLFHVASAACCIVLVEFLLPASTLPWVAGSVGLFGWTLEVTRRYSESWNDKLMDFSFFRYVAHPRERHHVNSSTWYVTALFLLSLLHSPAVSAVGLAVLGIADPAAAVIGRRWGRTRLAHNRSLEGTLAFFVTGTIAAWAVLVAFHPVASLLGCLLIAAGASLAGAVAELYSKSIDDNMTVPLSAAIGAWVVGLTLGVDFIF